ncbi:hypothetical protein [Legionella maioricensis]|uniref:Secreted protein n=1 Tax=Legionella maioricensis TaxID=2896528 RepID=A0A9X2CZQ6_9GAMM|nr:hypothetical protein [Legionella maioricensis]MCL9683844.1 hypothetical protein [Legionella maioricensis]MCL9686691.1 hypothetical protein [Legionella maioricensis]
MKHFFLTLLLSLVSSMTAYAAQKSVICTMKGIEDPISFIVPGKTGDLPEIDFSYPVDVTRFSMRSGNLLLVAMDHEETTRPRIFISAQLAQNSHAYTGQFMTDFGGNQLQLDNGQVSCTIK